MRAFALLLLAGCATSYQLDAPKAFKQYQGVPGHELITADGVMLKVRSIDNYPKADLEFWRAAMKAHLDLRGYAFKSERCFEAKSGLAGCTLDFIVPRGAEDWVMSETVFVDGERLHLVEVAGPFARYAPLEGALGEAMRSFSPGR